MNLQTLLTAIPDDELIVKRIIELYPDMVGNQEGFYKILPQLRKKMPIKSDMIAVVKYETDFFDNEEYIHVCGEPVNPVEDGDFVLYALDFTEWAEWLGMRIHPSSLQAFSELDILAHCLWEMTWHGFDEAEILAEADRLLDSAKDIKNKYGQAEDSQ